MVETADDKAIPEEHHHSADEHLAHLEASLVQATEAVNRKAGRNLPAAVGVAIALIGLVAVFLIWWQWGFVLLVTGLLVSAEIEMTRVLRRQRGWRVTIVPLAIGTVFTFVGAYAVLLYGTPSSRVSTALTATPAASAGVYVLACLMLTALFCFVVRLIQGVSGFVADVGATFFLIAYLPLLAIPLIFLLADDKGPIRVTLVILCVVASDTGGWLAGILFGRHKMVPRISPGKSWEGLAGSFVLAMAAGGLVAGLFLGTAFWRGIVVAAVIVVFAVAGDLAESAMKRDLGVKDMGSELPGHGGLMDRFDSFVASAPVGWLLLTALV